MKISFCITCMNRLYHLQETLPINLFMARAYGNYEFVIMDYNSTDGLEKWAKKHLMLYQKEGVLKYLKSRIPTIFSASHAKNIAHKNATGDILCNLDADNFITEDFCLVIKQIFEKNQSVLLNAAGIDFFGNPGTAGRILIKREHFYAVNGYDEDHENWGWDDTNLQTRAKLHNNLQYYQLAPKFIRCINHDNYERTRNYIEKNIQKSERKSIERINEICRNQSYIANQNKIWGHINDLSIGL